MRGGDDAEASATDCAPVLVAAGAIGARRGLEVAP